MFKKYFPILVWIKHYTYDDFASDTVAAIVVTIMLIPQSLAYALLAGLPPQIGLYASIIPLLIYSNLEHLTHLQSVQLLLLP